MKPARRLTTRFAHPRLRHALLLLLLLGSGFTPAGVRAATREVPAWYSMSAVLGAPPQVQVPLQVKVTVGALAGDLREVRVSLLAPAGWSPATPTARADLIPAGKSQEFSFGLVPAGPLPNGAVVAVLQARVPKEALGEAIRREAGPEGEGLLERVAAMPETGEGFADISFALFAEEGFYPLSGDMWTCYDDRLKPAGLTRGPVLFREALITPFQAQTDVEMYEKLARLLQTDAALARNLAESGIDLERKRADFLLGLYILGTEAYLKGEAETAGRFLARLQGELANAPARLAHDLAIPAGNLLGLVRWAQGDRKGALEVLRKTFYADRKEPSQRYVLRNMGLLMLESGDRATARETFRLALDLKPAYPLLREEFDTLRKP